DYLWAVLRAEPDGRPTVVSFSTPSCAACKSSQGPALVALKAKLGGSLRVILVDASERPEVASTFGVLTVPATVVLDSRGGVADLFLGKPATPVPYVIGIGGSVAVGKSTFARILRALVGRWPNHPKVDLVTTDGFLYPNQVLEERGLMNRKGFPDSFDLRRLLRFLS